MEFKKSNLDKIRGELQLFYEDKFEKYKESTELEYIEKTKNAESELNAALTDAQNELESVVKGIDDIIGDKVQELIDKTTLWMKCGCSDKLIPCEMDLSKPDENTFKCPDCGAVYRVQFSYYPVMIKREINDNQLINILEKNKFKGGNN